MKPVTTKQLQELLVRCHGGDNRVWREDLDSFLKNPALWRQKQESVAEPLEGEELRLWMQGVYDELGIICTVPAPPGLTKKQRKSLRQFGFRLLYIPAISETEYPKSFISLNWGYHLSESKIEHHVLPGRWVAVETIAKPNWDDQDGYPNDRLAAAISLKSRFRLSWDDLQQKHLPDIARVTGFSKKKTGLPTAELWNLVANLLNWLREHRGESLPNLGSTYSWEWCENVYDSDDRLCVGDRESGGLAGVHYDWPGDRHDVFAFRVLAVL